VPNSSIEGEAQTYKPFHENAWIQPYPRRRGAAPGTVCIDVLLVAEGIQGAYRYSHRLIGFSIGRRMTLPALTATVGFTTAAAHLVISEGGRRARGSSIPIA
jgi:hypothetical protein